MQTKTNHANINEPCKQKQTMQTQTNHANTNKPCKHKQTMQINTNYSNTNKPCKQKQTVQTQTNHANTNKQFQVNVDIIKIPAGLLMLRHAWLEVGYLSWRHRRRTKKNMLSSLVTNIKRFTDVRGCAEVNSFRER